MNTQSLAALMAVSAFTPGVVAELPSTHIEKILVTATRTALTTDETLAAVSVIDRQKIEQLQPTDLLDLLSMTPGIDASRNGGRGANTSVFLRGTNNGHTLVLVDGVRLGSATLGTVSLQHVDIAQVERVEIVRGPRSSLYGSEAIGGVIQIFSRAPQGQFNPKISLGYGTDNTLESSLAVAGVIGANKLSLTVSHLETAGIDSQEFDGNTDGDDDAYRNTSANVTFGRSFESGVEFFASYSDSRGQNEYDQGNGFSAVADAAPYGEFELDSSRVSLALPVSESWLSTFSLGRSTDESQSRDDNLPRFDEFITYKNQAAWQNDIQLNDNYLLTLGYDYLENEVDGTQTYSDDRRSNRAVFGQIQGNLPGSVDVTGGYRRDKNDQFGYHTTYNIAVGFNLNKSHRFIVSRGTAFKAPTFNDLYWPASPWSAGNSELAPEESVSTELEIRGNYDELSWSLTAYRNTIENLINWAETSPFFWQPSNVNSAKIRGSEFAISTTLANWNFNAAATYLEPEDEQTGNLLARRAKKSVSAQLHRQFGKTRVGLNWQAQSHRFDDSANTARLAGYGIVGVRIAYTISPQLSAKLAVNNIFGKDYQLSDSYSTDNGSAFVSITYSM